MELGGDPGPPCSNPVPVPQSPALYRHYKSHKWTPALPPKTDKPLLSPFVMVYAQFRGSATISRHLRRANTSPSICFTFWRCLHPLPNLGTTVNAALAEARSQTHIPRARNGCHGLSLAAFDEPREGKGAKLTQILLSRALHSPIHPPAFPLQHTPPPGQAIQRSHFGLALQEDDYLPSA